jgi:hypothetical protein
MCMIKLIYFEKSYYTISNKILRNSYHTINVAVSIMTRQSFLNEISIIVLHMFYVKLA